MRATLCTLALAAALAAPALAAPPEDAMPLSEILAGIEAEADFGSFKEVEWDDDGYWEIEYFSGDGREIKLEIDPRTGAPRG